MGEIITVSLGRQSWAHANEWSLSLRSCYSGARGGRGDLARGSRWFQLESHHQHHSVAWWWRGAVWSVPVLTCSWSFLFPGGAVLCRGEGGKQVTSGASREASPPSQDVWHLHRFVWCSSGRCGAVEGQTAKIFPRQSAVSRQSVLEE